MTTVQSTALRELLASIHERHADYEVVNTVGDCMHLRRYGVCLFRVRDFTDYCVLETTLMSPHDETYCASRGFELIDYRPDGIRAAVKLTTPEDAERARMYLIADMSLPNHTLLMRLAAGEEGK